MGPDERGRIALVAHRFYKQGMPQTEIAKEIGVSRFKVARWLDQALAEGIVRIEISLPGNVDADLSIALTEKFGLRRALAVQPDSLEQSSINDALGRCAADLVAETVASDDVLGVTSGRTLISMASHLRGLSNCEVVQLTGLAGGHADNSAEVIRRIAGRSRGRVHSIYAPLLVRDAETASALRTEPSVAGATARFDDVTTAVVAIGSWSPPESQLHTALDKPTRDRLIELGVRAEVGATLLDAQGHPINALNNRTIAIRHDQLLRIPEIIAIAGGERKHSAIKAVLNGGFVTTLVTDTATAAYLAES